MHPHLISQQGPLFSFTPFKLPPNFKIDGYKGGHHLQYPEGTEFVYSNGTCRSSRIAHTSGRVLPDFDDKIMWYGFQGYVLRCIVGDWNHNFFAKDKSEVCWTYADMMTTYLGVTVTVEHMEALHDLGYLPLRIKALPEGYRVNIRVPVFTIENTLSDFYWLTNYIETECSSEVWKGFTVATIAFEFRRLIQAWATKTGNTDLVLVQGHDFSLRGMSGIQDGAAAGGGHLLSFLGTDTIPAIPYLQQYYAAADDGTGVFDRNKVIGVSVYATEHAVMTANGSKTLEQEIEAFRRLRTVVHPTGLLSIVSDTRNLWDVIGTGPHTVVNQIKQEILYVQPNAQGMAKTIFRPDSGNPVDIICGTAIPLGVRSDSRMLKGALLAARTEYPEAKHFSTFDGHFIQTWFEEGDLHYTGVAQITDEMRGAVECLYLNFGGSTSTGTDGLPYITMHDKVGLIYGEGISLERASDIFKRLAAKGFSAANIVFGIGSYTYQCNSRDTFGFAMKATWTQCNGEGVEMFKNPATDDGTKHSAKGLLCVEHFDWAQGNKTGSEFRLTDQATREQEQGGALRTIFQNGQVFEENLDTLDTIRGRVEQELKLRLTTQTPV